MNARRLLSVVGLARPVRVRDPKRPRGRRGVVSVLSMMFVVMFGSLVAAMAISSQGNLRTAASHLHVNRSMHAAETGLAMAEARMGEATGRFIVANSTIDGSFATNLWNGNLGALGEVEVLPPPSGHYEPGTPAGLAEAVSFIHAADAQMNATPGCTTIRLHALRGLLGWLDPRRKPILVQLPGGLPR